MTKVEIIGNLTRDIEIAESDSGRKYARFTLMRVQNVVEAAELIRELADISKLIRACNNPADLRKAHEILLSAREQLDDAIARTAIRLQYVRHSDVAAHGCRLRLVR